MALSYNLLTYFLSRRFLYTARKLREIQASGQLNLDDTQIIACSAITTEQFEEMNNQDFDHFSKLSYYLSLSIYLPIYVEKP